jgi:recombination protein RecT
MTTTSIDKIARGEKAETPVVKFTRFLDKMKPQIAMALPKHLNADRMARLALTQFSSNPALQECDSVSIAGAIITAAQLGLEIGVNGQAYMIPYKGRATFVPGWKGLVDLANRSGRCTVWTGAVFEGDSFDYALGDSPFVKHKPGDEDHPDALLYVYAIGRVRGAEQPVVEVWPMSKIWKHRDRFNKVGKRHYSFEHPEMYARKIPLLQVLKYMPASIELSTGIQIAERADTGEGMVFEGEPYVTEQRPAVDPDTGETSAPAKSRTYAAFTEAIKAAGDAEIASLVLDQARDELADDLFEDLVAFYKVTWPAN